VVVLLPSAHPNRSSSNFGKAGASAWHDHSCHGLNYQGNVAVHSARRTCGRKSKCTKLLGVQVRRQRRWVQRGGIPPGAAALAWEETSCTALRLETACITCSGQ
jgi:hypothetical protein